MRKLYSVTANITGIGPHEFFLSQTTLNTDKMKKQIRTHVSNNIKKFTTDNDIKINPIEIINISLLTSTECPNLHYIEEGVGENT